MVLKLGMLSLVAGLLGMAQSNNATISGSVTDNQGASITGAQVVATETDTSVKTTAITNEAGVYSLRNLPIGTYVLTAEHPGFRRYVREGLTLTTGQSLGLDLRLELGAVADSINVSASASLLETRTSDVSQLVESKSIEDIPLGDRRTMNIINITGAAVFVAYDAGAKPNFSLAGGRTQSQMFWIDGGTGQNMRLGIGQIDLDPPVETVEEVKVLSNSYAAEYGGSAGGTIIATTKSGTNHFHGSLSEYFRNDKLDAPGFFAPVQNGVKIRPELRYNVFGGTLGGPVIHDKTFFFFGYEGARRRDGAIDTLTVPTDLQRVGDFSQTFNARGQLIPIYDPETTALVAGKTVRTAFQNNRIPSNHLDPVALAILNFYPRPNRPADNVTGANNFRANYVTALTRNNITAKVDHNLGTRDKINARYLYNSDNTANTSVFPDPASGTRIDAERHQQYWYGSWTRILTPSLINDFRVTYANRINHQLTKGLGQDYASKLGLKGVSPDAFPQFTVAGFSTLGSNQQERRQLPIEQYQFVNNVSWVRGRHSFKFGGEARPARNYEVNLPTVSGAFGFATTPTGLPDNAATGIGLASLLLGFPTSFDARQTQILDRSNWYLAGFAQDDWTIRNDLTLNLGLRWETDTPIVDKNNRMNSFDLHAINPVSGTPGVIKFTGMNGFPSKPYDTDWNNFGPRVGFAWKPFGSKSTVVRGGFGIFFAHPFDSGQPSSASLGFELSSTLNSPDNGITAPFLLRNGVPATLKAPELSDAFGAVRVGQQPNTAVTYFDPHRATGYSQQFNVGVQRELPGSMVLEVSYLANLSRKLPSTNISLNQISPAILGPAHQSQSDRPFPQFSNVTIVSPTLGVSNYHAALVKFEKRFSRGLNIVSTYTYSKFLDNTGDGGTALGASGGPYSNYYNRRADYGPSDNDIPHRFTFSSVYELPFGAGQPFLATNPLRYIVGNWVIGNVTTLQSGPAFTVTTQTNSTNSFSAGALRADVSRNPNLPSDQRSVNHYFDTEAFSQPAPFQFGNQGVNILRSAGLVNFDFSVLRNFPIRERMRLQLRGEFFNALNRTDFGIPGRTFGGPGFGIVNSASKAARQIQLGLRLTF
ncbi:MAG: carboxypeptidase regulatory-like domain-containing protein [Acidobacteriota bacterium]|nr:carboxypeptidase regulatory-like domain-containing protein [Acidobacteriota bacterium]